MTLLMVLYLGSQLTVPKPEDSELNLYRFGQIPVREQGRLKPLDSVARNTLRALSKKVEFEDLNEEKQPAIKFLLDLMTPIKESENGEEFAVGTRADGYEIFYIENLESQQFLDLEKRKGFLYSFDEISAPPKDDEDAKLYSSKIDKLQAHLQNVSAIQQGEKEGEVSLMDLKLQEVAEKIRIYRQARADAGHDPQTGRRAKLCEQLGVHGEERVAAIGRVTGGREGHGHLSGDGCDVVVVVLAVRGVV